MMTYVSLNAAFFAALALIMFVTLKHTHLKALAMAFGIVVGLTALFDPIMIAVGLVAYDTDKLLGLYWLGAPIEDFAYALFAVPFVACLWNILERRDV